MTGRKHPRLTLLVGFGVLAISLTGCGGGAAQSPFEYDPKQPLAVETVSSQQSDGIIVQDLTYAANGQRTKAYLVRPDGAVPFPAVLFLHWLGEPNGDRDEFLAEAKALAKQGVAGLLVDGAVPWHVAPKNAPEDRQQVINQVVALRRGLDLLAARPEVDPNRLVFVGHDFGAMHGVLLASSDSRVRAGVFMTPVPTYADWYLTYFLRLNADPEAQYKQTMSDVDPITRIPQVKVPILMQYSTRDRFMHKELALRLYDAARTTKEIRWYDTDHELDKDAQLYRIAWVLGQVTGPAKRQLSQGGFDFRPPRF